MTDQAPGETAAVPAAGEQAQGDQGQQGQGDQQNQEVTVPLHVVKSIQEELKGQKAANADLQTKFAAAQAQQQMGQTFQQQQPQPAPPAQQAPPAEQEQKIFDGMDDDDILSVKDVRNALSSMKPQNTIAPELDSQIQRMNATIAQMQVAQQDPQYEQTIREYLPELINTNPQFKEMIARSPNPLQAALTVSRMNPRFAQAQQAGQEQAQAPVDPLSQLAQIIENATKPGSPASAGGQGGTMTGRGRYSDMDPTGAEFDAEVRRVLES